MKRPDWLTPKQAWFLLATIWTGLTLGNGWAAVDAYLDGDHVGAVIGGSVTALLVVVGIVSLVGRRRSQSRRAEQ